MRNRKGFTLIEVLVVVAIIGLLVSILIPALSRARDSARSAKCLANMRDMITGVNTFAPGHRSRFQLVTGANGIADEDPNKSVFAYDSTRELMVWPAVLLRESGVRSIRANTDWGILGQSAASQNRANIRRFETMSCPSDKIEFGSSGWPQPYYGYLSYGANEDVLGARTDVARNKSAWKDGVGNSGPRLAGRLDQVKRPGEVLLFADAGSGKMLGSQGGPQSGPDVFNLLLSKDCAGPMLEHYDAYWHRMDDTADQQPFLRHQYGSKRGGVNLAYVDGHAGFARRFDRPGGTPAFAYQPKVRISPHSPGEYKH